MSADYRAVSSLFCTVGIMFIRDFFVFSTGFSSTVLGEKICETAISSAMYESGQTEFTGKTFDKLRRVFLPGKDRRSLRLFNLYWWLIWTFLRR